MRTIRGALVLAGVILAVPLVLALAVRSDLIANDTAERLRQVIMGMVLVISANVVPKMLKPLAEERCGASTTQAVQRFAGWTLVLAGLGYAVAWVILPIDRASVVATSIVAAGVVLVMARVLGAFMSKNRVQPPADL